ncbi:hypothetical protein KW785_02840 [Candidatus Parcubacteria bacterium]|nr:hypothetical protein [Candidatus Parcubacteria bacterium]
MKSLGVLLLSIAFLPSFVFAQTDPSDIGKVTNTFTVTITPSTPGPNEKVTASIQSFGLELDTSLITWKLGGATLASGKGITTINFSTGALGTHQTLTVTAATSEGLVTRSVEISPSSVDLLWQGYSYTPPFYTGRSLWGYQGNLTLLAIPHLEDSQAPGSLIYKWSKNGTVLSSLSGTGKDSITFADTILALPTTIQVEVMTDSETVVGSASIALRAVSPRALVYEDNPLYGIVFGNAASEKVALRGKEVSFAAFPFFMSASSRTASGLKYSWTTNGTGEQMTNRVTYRAPDNVSGSTRVHVDISNLNTALQGASKDFLVQFGNDNAF